jgi:hypothetical protein
MAKRSESASSQKPQNQSKDKQRWWKAPAVIAALIGAVAAVTVAYIQFIAPKPQPSALPNIEIQTHGPNSPAVGHTGGNVTIHQESGGQKP